MANLNPAFQPLEKLIGTWKCVGRTIGATEDNVFCDLTVQPILGGRYIELRGHFTFQGYEFDAIEIVHYDPKAKRFPSEAYANMGEGPGEAVPYEWYVEDDGTVVHKGAGAIYHGKFSQDYSVLDGGWRPDESADSRPEASYDLKMTRV